MDLYPTVSLGKIVDGPHFIGLSEVRQVGQNISPHLLSLKSGSSRPWKMDHPCGLAWLASVRESPFVEVTPFWCYIASPSFEPPVYQLEAARQKPANP